MAQKPNKKDDPSKVKKDKIDSQIKTYIIKADQYLKDKNYKDAIKNYMKVLEQIESKYKNISTGIDPNIFSEGDQIPFFKAALRLVSIYGKKDPKKYKERAKHYISICSKSNVPEIHYQLGNIHLDPEITLANTERAKDHLSFAANHGHEGAKKKLNQIEDAQRNSAHQIELNITAEQQSNFDSGSITSQETSSQLSTSNRTSLAETSTKETDWMRQNMDSIKADADRGDNDSQFTLGYMYEYGVGVERNTEGAIKWYQRAADKNHWNACCNLGYIYERRKEYKKAFELYQCAAKWDCTQAQYNLGSLYAQGLGTRKDKNMSIHWFERAAAKNHHEAKANVGYYYWKKGEFEKAEKYYTGAANGGDVLRAHFAVAWLFDKRGEDSEKVKIVYEKCTKRGHLPGTNNLGCYYETKGDKKKALTYYMEAARGDYDLAIDNLKRLYENMKPSEDDHGVKSFLEKYARMNSSIMSNHNPTKHKKNQPSSDSRSNSTYFIKQNLTHDFKLPYRIFEYHKKNRSNVVWYEQGLISQYAKPGLPDNKSALQHYFNAENNPAALYKLASMYYLAHGVNYDLDEAIKYLEKVKTIPIQQSSRFICPLEEDPDTTNNKETKFCVKNSNELLAEIYCALGYLYEHKGDHLNKIKHFIMASYMGCTEAKEELKEIINQQNLVNINK